MDWAVSVRRHPEYEAARFKEVFCMSEPASKTTCDT